MQAAFRAARRGQTHGLPPDVGTVNALLHGCLVSREVANAWRCMRLAEELGVEPNGRHAPAWPTPTPNPALAPTPVPAPTPAPTPDPDLDPEPRP